MFLNSLLLYGTALGSIPIIIHLLNKRRFRPVTWAAMEFLMQAIQKNARRLQLRDIILMLIRTAAVVCLALALSRRNLAMSRTEQQRGTGYGARCEQRPTLQCNTIAHFSRIAQPGRPLQPQTIHPRRKR